MHGIGSPDEGDYDEHTGIGFVKITKMFMMLNSSFIGTISFDRLHL